MGESWWSTLFYVVIMVAVLLAAYFTTKYLSGKTRRIIKSKHIIILDRMGIAKDKSLMLAKVGDKCLLIGVTNQSINSLGEVNIGDISEIEDEPVSQPGAGALSKFAQILSNAKSAPSELAKARTEAKHKKQEDTVPRDTVEDDYIDQITRAIERRKNPKGHHNGGMDE
jgi:flagellar biogenesis protein FliO